MINLIINFLFFIVNSLYTIILSPIFLGINALLPDSVDFLGHVTDFLTQGLSYVGTVAGLLCIPTACLTLVFTWFECKFLIFALIKVGKLALNIWQKLKP